MASPIYTGARVFESLSVKTGIPLDQFNFVAGEFCALLFAFGLRLSLPHSLGKPTWRHIYCLTGGALLLFWMIGWSSWLVIAQPLVCYLLMRCLPHSSMQLCVFAFAMIYMLILYVLRLMEKFEYLCYDATYPLMITTQKVTTLAFSLSDWTLAYKKGQKIQEERVKWAVKDVPSFLEYLAFVFNFQGVLAGPFCHYNMYRAFIEGNTPQRLQESKYPVQYMDDPGSCLKAVFTKIIAVIFWIIITAWVKPFFPDSTNVDPHFIAEHSMLTRIGYLYISLFFHRAKYYVTWILADAVYNASGLGYAGKDEKGNPRWTAMSNVFVLKIETATSLKVYLDNWNILTTHWLRHVCYMRAPVLNTFLTFTLSALWHGLFIGYYVTFVSAAFFVEAGRKIRSSIRPLFQSSKRSKQVYEVITWFGTQLSLAFLVLSFVILHWEPTIHFHNSFYWICHVMVIVLLVALPSRRSSSRHQQPQQQGNLQNKHLPQQQENGKELEDGMGDADSKLRKRDVMFVQKS